MTIFDIVAHSDKKKSVDATLFDAQKGSEVSPVDVKVFDVITQGNRHQSLETLRDRLAKEIDESIGRDVAVLVKELRATMAELYAIPGEREGSKSDELAARRASRRAGAAGP